MPLQTKYRAKQVNSLIGNEGLKKSLSSVLDRAKDVPHSFFFTGPSGCGKTTMAYILKSHFKVSDTDFHVYNAANTRGIDTIREISDSSRYSPVYGKYKLYLLDECHQITGVAQEALLLMLEEPPSHVIYVLSTTEPEKIKITIKRRCFCGELELLDRETIKKGLRDIFKKEDVSLVEDDYIFPESLIAEIARCSEGSFGRALSLLDSTIDMEDESEAVATVSKIVTAESFTIDLCRALTAGKDWNTVKTLLTNYTGDIESARYAVLGYLSKVLLNSEGSKAEDIATTMLNFNDSFMYTGKGGLILACYFSCST